MHNCMDCISLCSVDVVRMDGTAGSIDRHASDGASLRPDDPLGHLDRMAG